MKLAEVVRSRADCTRRRVGAVIVRDFRIITTGYNGTPHGIKNCSDGGCERCKKRDEGTIEWYEYEEHCICIHAEQNAIVQAAYQGASTKGATLYSTTLPCSTCSKIIINAAIREVVFTEDHPESEAFKILRLGKILVRRFKTQ